jgi:hypothetical protein
MDVPIKFDHQSAIRATEVDDEWPDRVLAAELQAVKLPATNELPQRGLGRSLPNAQLAG